jgi:hypothetical protein
MQGHARVAARYEIVLCPATEARAARKVGVTI